MLYYHRIDVSDVIKNNSSKECIICLRWFFHHGLEFQNPIYNGWHNLMMLCLNFSDTAIVTVKGVDYRCIIYNISKYESIHLSENSVLEDRGYI